MSDNIELEMDNVSDVYVMEPYIDKLRETLNVPADWIYRPVGWMRNDFYDMFIDVVGEKNMKFVSQMTTRFADDQKMYTRASLFVSPGGIQNINTYLSIKESDTDEQRT